MNYQEGEELWGQDVGEGQRGKSNTWVWSQSKHHLLTRKEALLRALWDQRGREESRSGWTSSGLDPHFYLDHIRAPMDDKIKNKQPDRRQKQMGNYLARGCPKYVVLYSHQKSYKQEARMLDLEGKDLQMATGVWGLRRPDMIFQRWTYAAPAQMSMSMQHLTGT